MCGVPKYNILPFNGLRTGENSVTAFLIASLLVAVSQFWEVYISSAIISTARLPVICPKIPRALQEG